MKTKSVKLKFYIILILTFFVSMFAFTFSMSSDNKALAADGNNFKIAGAGVKIVNDKDDSGLRFSFIIKKDYFNGVLSTGSQFKTGVETGALIVPTRFLPDGFDSEDALKSVSGSKIIKKSIGYNFWTDSSKFDGYKESYVYLYGLPESCYNWDVTCIGYITINGVTKYTSICERSMSYVANAAINDQNSGLKPSEKEMLGLYLTNQKLTVNDVEYTNMTYGKTLNEFVVANGLMPNNCDYVVFKDAAGNYVPNSTIIEKSMVLSATYYKGVSTLSELRAINGSTDNYILLNDIDAENATFANTDFIPSFGGILEGNGYAIKNVKIKAGSRYWVAALFGTISGTVQNLKLENITICKSADNTYTGKAAFMAGSITGTVKNIWITGTMEASTADTSSKDKRPAFIANDATGGNVSNFLIEVANTVAGTYVVTGGTATHWGGVHAIGTASGWAGAGTRDLGVSISLNADASAVYNEAIKDLTDNVWTRDATTGVITMVKGGYLDYYTVETYVETGVNNTGKYVLDSVEKYLIEDCALSTEYTAPSKTHYTLNESSSITEITFKSNKTIKLYYDLDDVNITVKNAEGTETLYTGDIPFGSIFDQSAVLASDEVGTYQTEGGDAFDINSPITEDTVLCLAETYKKITTLAELRAINGSTDNYILLNDIDAENATFANTDFIPSFGGVLEGNGYAIKNVKVKAGSRYWVAALFGTISGTVQNLKLENITICKSGDNTYTGKAAFMAGSITGTVKNIWITGTMEESTADTSSKISRPSIVANDATGGNISDILIEVDSIVTFTYIITGGTATHWGGVYVIGPASGWSGWAAAGTRDLGSIAGPSTDAAAMYNSASADLTDNVWTRDATTGVITMVKGFYLKISSVKPYNYAADSYKPITTLAELRAINGSTDNYILLNDIDAENATFANFDFIPSFGGILEGNGYAIKNVKVKAGAQYNNTALFGTISGTVQNLKLENITICKSANNTNTGAAAFMAVNITGTVNNIWITGTMEASTATTWGTYRPAFIANNAEGGSISNFLIEVANTVSGTYVVTGRTATHWGGVYVIGSASGWAGTGSSRDLGVSISLSTDAAAVYNEAIKDLTDDVWTRDATTGVITMVKGYKSSTLNYTVKYYFENENGVFVPEDSKEYTSTHEFGASVSIETDDVSGYDVVMDYSNVLLLADNQVVTVLYKKTEISNDDDIEYTVEYYYEQNDGTFIKDDSKTEYRYGKGNSVIKVTASAASAVANYHTDTYSDFDVVDLVLDEFGKVAKIYYFLDTYEIMVLDANDNNNVVYRGGVVKDTSFDTTSIIFTDSSAVFSLKDANGVDYVNQNVTDNLTLYIVYGKAVSTTEDFFNIDSTSNYVLTNDIDFTGVEFTQVPTLGGVFDGNGYSLKNITMAKKDSYGKGGIFGEVTGTVKNLSVDNLTFIGTGKSGSEYVGESGILAYTVSGTVKDVSINATITGKLRGHNGWTDFSGWNWHFGYVCFNANGATIKNVVVNVSNAVNSADISRFYLCSATGNYTLGSLYVVNQDGETNPSAVSGGSATALSGRWVGIDSPDVIVSVMAARVDYTVWNYDKQDAVPYLRKNVYNPTYFYDGQSCGYTVCYSGVASEGELAGKNLIVDLTSDMLGVTLTETNSGLHFDANEKRISIGITVVSNEYAVTQGYANTTALLNAYNVGRSGFIIRTVGKTVLIMGLTSEACYYGCQEFANMVFGYEQFTDEAYIVDETINSSSKIILGQYDIVDIPDIANRAVYFYNVNDQKDDDGDVIVDNSAYRYAMRLEDANDKNTYIVGGHSQEMFVNQNISSHPGWFPDDVFCWSNTTAVNAFVDSLFSIYAGAESDRNYNNYLIHLGQCDVDNYCKCNNCKNARKAYGGETNKAVSAQQLAFVNSVADKFMTKLATDGNGYTKPVYSPNIVFTIFAYMYSQTPPATYSSGTWTPLVTANANVSFFFTPIRDDYSISVDEQSTKNDFEGWKAVCSNSNIFVWTYGTNFKQYFVNINNFDAIKGTYKFYAENGVTYILDQGPSTSGTPTFEELRVYLDSKLMWNTDRSTSLLVDKFINGYYGPGAWGVKQYYNAIKDTTVSGIIYENIGTSSIWTNEKLNSLATWLDNAIAAVEGSDLSSDAKTEYKNRIYRLYCTIWYLQADLNYANVSSYTKAQAIANLKYYAAMYNMIEYAETHSLKDKSWY